nr:hypothetical protein GCM10020063_020980 [Dactylosporangium thailandense]
MEHGDETGRAMIMNGRHDDVIVGIGIPPLSPGPVQARANLLWELTDEVQRWHEKYPAVPAMARVPAGDPAGVLLEASG